MPEGTAGRGYPGMDKGGEKMSNVFISRRGGGGTGGKVNAISVASAENLPASAKEGTIAVITSTAIKNVYVQNTEPTVVEVGDVWISTGVASTVPVQLGNATLYPSAVKQYVTGEWKSVSAYVFFSGSWMTLEMYLFRSGDQNESVTGGWLAAKRMYGVPVIGETALEAAYGTANQSYNRVLFRTKNAVDLSAYKTLKASFTPITRNHSGRSVAVGVGNSPFAEGALEETESTLAACTIGYAQTTDAQPQNFTLEYDISELSDSLYVVVHIHSSECSCISVQLIP